jgi:hypothetical protein
MCDYHSLIVSPFNFARMSHLPYFVQPKSQKGSKPSSGKLSRLLTSVFANVYPTMLGTTMTYMKEIHAVRGVHLKYLHLSLFNSIRARQPVLVYIQDRRRIAQQDC